jgi:RNA polymerase-binding protein DksA
MDTERFRTALLDERRRVVDAIEYLKKETPDEDDLDDTSGVENHLGDQASGTLDREIDYTLKEDAEQVLAQIDAALQRIEDGTYGMCERGDKEIGEERLEARPWATLCIDHQREVERG